MVGKVSFHTLLVARVCSHSVKFPDISNWKRLCHILMAHCIKALPNMLRMQPMSSCWLQAPNSHQARSNHRGDGHDSSAIWILLCNIPIMYQPLSREWLRVRKPLGVRFNIGFVFMGKARYGNISSHRLESIIAIRDYLAKFTRINPIVKKSALTNN